MSVKKYFFKVTSKESLKIYSMITVAYLVVQYVAHDKIYLPRTVMKVNIIPRAFPVHQSICALASPGFGSLLCYDECSG